MLFSQGRGLHPPDESDCSKASLKDAEAAHAEFRTLHLALVEARSALDARQNLINDLELEREKLKEGSCGRMEELELSLHEESKYQYKKSWNHPSVNCNKRSWKEVEKLLFALSAALFERDKVKKDFKNLGELLC